MKMVYTRMGRGEPAEEDELGQPDQKLVLTGWGVGLMTIGLSEAVDDIDDLDDLDESDESDEYVEDVGADGTMA
jgi:hypothetical protein